MYFIGLSACLPLCMVAKKKLGSAHVTLNINR